MMNTAAALMVAGFDPLKVAKVAGHRKMPNKLLSILRVLTGNQRGKGGGKLT